jgi:hypothetical protein
MRRSGDPTAPAPIVGDVLPGSAGHIAEQTVSTISRVTT